MWFCVINGDVSTIIRAAFVSYSEMRILFARLIVALGSVAPRDSIRAKKNGVQRAKGRACTGSSRSKTIPQPDRSKPNARKPKNKLINTPRPNLLALKLRIITR